MGVGAGLYMYDVVVKRLRLLSHLLMNSCQTNRQDHFQPCDLKHWSIWPCRSNMTDSVWRCVIASNIQVKGRFLRKLSHTHTDAHKRRTAKTVGNHRVQSTLSHGRVWMSHSLEMWHESDNASTVCKSCVDRQTTADLGPFPSAPHYTAALESNGQRRIWPRAD